MVWIGSENYVGCTLRIKRGNKVIAFLFVNHKYGRIRFPCGQHNQIHGRMLVAINPYARGVIHLECLNEFMIGFNTLSCNEPLFNVFKKTRYINRWIVVGLKRVGISYGFIKALLERR